MASVFVVLVCWTRSSSRIKESTTSSKDFEKRIMRGLEKDESEKSALPNVPIVSKVDCTKQANSDFSSCFNRFSQRAGVNSKVSRLRFDSSEYRGYPSPFARPVV